MTLWPELPVEQVPITHVTNGVHLPTWLGAPMRELLDRHLRGGWIERAAEPDVWAAVGADPDRGALGGAQRAARAARRVRPRAQRRRAPRARRRARVRAGRRRSASIRTR